MMDLTTAGVIRWTGALAVDLRTSLKRRRRAEAIEAARAGLRGGIRRTPGRAVPDGAAALPRQRGRRGGPAPGQWAACVHQLRPVEEPLGGARLAVHHPDPDPPQP